jgi:RHS repeat-associated protein
VKTPLFGRLKFVAVLVFVLSCRLCATAQYLDQTGTPSFTTAHPVELGFINLANGNLHLEIPLASFPQRGSMGLTAKLVYDSRIWKKVGTTWQPTNVPNSQGGWRYVTSTDTGAVTYTSDGDLCGEPPNAGSFIIYYGFTWKDASGTSHYFDISTYRDIGCGEADDPTGDALANDSSGYHMYVTGWTSATVYARDGTQVYPTLKDTNGNYFSTDANGNAIDTLGRTPILKTVNGSQTYYDILDSRNLNPRPRITVTTTTINVNTAFGQSGFTEYAGTLTVIQSVSLPDGHSYTFDYDSGTTAGKYGLLKTITLPTGGQVAYTHTTFSDAYGNKNRWVNTRAAGGTWTYTPAVITSCGTSCSQKVTVTPPNQDEAVYTFTMNNGAWNSDTKVYTGSAASGTLLMTLLTDYDFSQPGSNYIRMVRNTTTLPRPGGNISKKTEYLYDTPQNANVTQIKEWNYYTGTPSATPDRKTDITYLATSAYTSKNIIDRPLSVTVRTGGGSWLSQTNFSYDSTTLTSITGVTQHDDSGFGTGNTTRGNLTAIQQYAASAGSCALPNCLSTTLTYDTTGQLRQGTDPKSNATTLSYTDNFFHDNVANPPQAYTPPAPSNAYLTSLTAPLIGAATFGYYFNTGKPAMTVDQNSADSYFHYADMLDRLTHTYGPVAAGSRVWSLLQRPSATQLDIYSAVTYPTPSTGCTSCVHQQVTFDNLGRPVRSTLVNDPDPGGATLADTAYDTAGRVQSVSNPYRSTSDPTYGFETPTYDGANRVTRITHQDQTSAQTFYGAAVTTGGGAGSQLCAAATYGVGFPVLSVDEAGKKRQVWFDGFGRIIEADEPDSGGTLNINTCYKYDLLNNLKEVNQGTQTRTYTYDGLSRLTASTTPEAGVLYLYYTTSAGALCAGDASAVCRRTDARSITSTYVYDALNRLTSVTYSNSTPASSFFYDQTSYNGLTILNGKGRRTGMSDGSGTTAWSYDALGRVLTKKRTISGVTKTISYTYNLNGSVATITYPSGRVITYTYSAIGRPLTAKDIANNINYATDALYAPPGAVASFKNGVVTGGFAGITTTNSYNNRLQPALLSAAAPSQTILSLTYAYGASNNGRIASIVNNLNNNRTQTFTYDTLRRLATAQSQATAGSDCWGQSFGYDRWGNLLTVNVTKCSAPSLSVTVNSATNHINSPGYGYDAAGNLTNGISVLLTYDAENRIVSAGSTTYTYDGDSLRVKTTSGKLYWRSIGIDTLTETDVSGNTTAEFIYFAGRRVAMRDGAGNVYYIFADHLGSSRIVTNSTGTVCRDMDYFPLGYPKITLNTCATLLYKFAGYERDVETGLNYAFARYQHEAWGRFMSPDPLEGSADNPQSLNRYAYVQNDPVNLVDPLGLIATIPPIDCGHEPPDPYDFPPIPTGGGSGGGPGGGTSAGGTTGGNFPNGETLGIPGGFPLPNLTLCQLMGLCPIAPDCNFGLCVPGGGFSSGAITWEPWIDVVTGAAKLARAFSLVGILGTVLTMEGDTPARFRPCRLVGDSVSRDGIRTCTYRCPSGRTVLLQGKVKEGLGMDCPRSIPDWGL